MNSQDSLVEGEDYYWVGATIVFTARYHLRRGYCCDNKCRHCPYADKLAEDESAATEDAQTSEAAP